MPSNEWTPIQEEENISSNPVVISIDNALEGERLKIFILQIHFNDLYGWFSFFSSILLHISTKKPCTCGNISWICKLYFILPGHTSLNYPEIYIYKRTFYYCGILTTHSDWNIHFLYLWFLKTPPIYSMNCNARIISSRYKLVFDNALNWVMVIIASICYGITKEINDVSTYGYVLSHADPSQYSKILARNNITFGIWCIIGLVISGIILMLPKPIAVLFLWIIIVWFLIFTIKYFDTSLESVSLKDIQNFKVSVQKWTKENTKEYLIQTVKKADIWKIIGSVKYIMLKPNQHTENEKFRGKKYYRQVKKNSGLLKIYSHINQYISILYGQ